MYSPNRCVNIIPSCVVLHNICRRHNVPLLAQGEEVEEEQEAEAPIDQIDKANDVRGADTRARVVAIYF